MNSQKKSFVSKAFFAVCALLLTQCVSFAGEADLIVPDFSKSPQSRGQAARGDRSAIASSRYRARDCKGSKRLPPSRPQESQARFCSKGAQAGDHR